MDIDTVLLETEEKMTKSIEYLQREYRGVRTGRANTALLEYVKVEYYGSNVDLREIAGISVPEPTQLLIKPFDPGSKAEIIKAIERSGLGLNPQSEGSQIRIMLPPPSSERRKQLAMQASPSTGNQKTQGSKRRVNTPHHTGFIKSGSPFFAQMRCAHTVHHHPHSQTSASSPT